MATHKTHKNKPSLAVGNKYYIYLIRTEQVAGPSGFKKSSFFTIKEIRPNVIIAKASTSLRTFSRDSWGLIDRYSRERISLR